jgi:N-acetylmuramoyl-L-alanine amidase
MTTLRRGSKGAAVKALQLDLNRAGAKLDPDGGFGELTEAAVKAFQRAHGLVEDGVAGRQTQAALKQVITPVKPGKPEPDKSAMGKPVPVDTDGKILADIAGADVAKVPPNAATLQLLATARPIDELFWHCSATVEGQDYTVADIRAWHKQRGFTDVGYQYVVYRDGRIMLGRPIGQIGAHVEGHNARSVGCCYIGGVAKDGKTPNDTRTPAQRSSMLWLTQQMLAKHRGIRKVRGHNEVAAKACPSFTVRRDALGRLAA